MITNRSVSATADELSQKKPAAVQCHATFRAMKHHFVTYTTVEAASHFFQSRAVERGA
jgi:hypothetical protein